MVMYMNLMAERIHAHTGAYRQGTPTPSDSDSGGSHAQPQTTQAWLGRVRRQNQKR